MPEPSRPFAERVYAVVSRIPERRVTTYGMIARQLGVPGAARTVGWAMHHCPEGLPWHRVIAAGGQPAPDAAGQRMALQFALLRDEGVVPNRDGRIDLERYGWEACQGIDDG